jgi:hypothetical protein
MSRGGRIALGLVVAGAAAGLLAATRGGDATPTAVAPSVEGVGAAALAEAPTTERWPSPAPSASLPAGRPSLEQPSALPAVFGTSFGALGDLEPDVQRALVGVRAAPSPASGATRPARLPQLKAPQGSAQRDEALRWFHALPATDGLPQGWAEATRKRLASDGMTLLGQECRSGVCLLSFVYSGATSKTLRGRFGATAGHAAIHERAWSFSSVLSDGRIQGDLITIQAN